MRHGFRPAVLFLIVLCGCAGTETETPPRLVVLFATCTLNRATLSPYDASVRHTPNLDAFAADAMVFDEHHTESGVSGPSFASIFTGTQADRHGVFYHPRVIPDERLLITEAFADGGYDPHFWSGHVMASVSFGYGQGVPPGNVTITERKPPAEQEKAFHRGDPHFDKVLRKLKDDPEYRAYLQINFTLTHGPYYNRTTPADRAAFLSRFPEYGEGLTEADIERAIALHDEHYYHFNWNLPELRERLQLPESEFQNLVRSLEVCYRATVYKLDRYFGAFVESLREAGLYDEALIAFTSDHGEMLYRENALFNWTHGKQLSPEVLRVPLIVRGPGTGIAAGRYPGITRSVDVFPTLAGLSAVDLPREAKLDGVDLTRSLRGAEPEKLLRSYSHTSLLTEAEYKRNGDLTLRNTLHPAKDPRYIWTLIRDGDLAYKLLCVAPGDWRIRVFDWTNDPGETRDLYDAGNPVHQRLAEDLEAYKTRLVEAYPWEEQGEISMSERLERLRSLGYIR